MEPKNSQVKPKNSILSRIAEKKREIGKKISFGNKRKRVASNYQLSKRVRALSKFVGRRAAFDILGIAKKLGEGSFGAVYSDKGLAIKVAAGSPLNKKGYAELEKEKKLLEDAQASGVSPQVIASGKGFIAIEKFDGNPLVDYEDRIAKDPVFANYIFIKIIEAIGALHRIGIAHSDLHNGNIFITNDYQVKIIDFGLAKKGYLSAYKEAYFGMYEDPGTGAITLIRDIFKNTSAQNTYIKIVYDTFIQICNELGADKKYVFMDYEKIRDEDEEDIYFDNFNKVSIPDDSKKYINLLYDRLDSAFKIHTRNPLKPKTGILSGYKKFSPEDKIKQYAEGGQTIPETLSLVGEKRGKIRAKSPIISRSQKIKAILKKARTSTITADQISIILDNLNKSDLSSLTTYIKPSGKGRNILNISDNSFYNFLKRFNNFLANFVKTLNVLSQNLRFVHEFLKIENIRFDKRAERLRRLVEKILSEKKEKEKKRKSIVQSLLNSVTGDTFWNIVGAIRAITDGSPTGEAAPPPTGPVPTGTNADFWTLAAVASLENSDAQGQADVAQAVYNRLQSGISSQYGGNTIKDLILAPGQFSPVGESNISLWRAIKDRQTAIAAVASHPNGRTVANATNKVDSAARNITNPQLQRNSASFVGGRTDFNALSVYDADPPNAVGTIQKRAGHRFGWWVGSGSQNYGRTNPGPKPIPTFSGITIPRASGAIVLPELFQTNKIYINESTNSLSEYFINKPTLLEIGMYDEPLIIIPLGRTKGKEIMNILFRDSFAKLENKFAQSSQTKVSDRINEININLFEESLTSQYGNCQNYEFKRNTNSINTRIDNISNTATSNFSKEKVVIYTQDIYVS